MEKAEKDGLWSCKTKKGWINTSILDKRDLRETRGEKITTDRTQVEPGKCFDLRSQELRFHGD